MVNSKRGMPKNKIFDCVLMCGSYDLLKGMNLRSKGSIKEFFLGVAVCNSLMMLVMVKKQNKNKLVLEWISRLTFLSFLAELVYEYYTQLMELEDWGIQFCWHSRKSQEIMRSLNIITVNMKTILLEMDYFLCLSNSEIPRLQYIFIASSP